MPKKSGRPFKRHVRYLFAHPCGCWFCCGDPVEYQLKVKQRIPKHKPKNWIEYEN